MGHVVVELGRRREQRTAAGAAGEDLAQQMFGQRSGHRSAGRAQHLRQP
jgi:hypothetical protein